MKKTLCIILSVLVIGLLAGSCALFSPTEPAPTPSPSPEPEPSPVANVPPVAYIDSISVSEATEGETVGFQGHGTDKDGEVVAYRWASDLDGNLATTATFDTESLSPGEHVITLKVQDNNGDWSEEASANVTVVATPPPPTGKPDLVVTDIRKVETDDGLIIGYTVENQGEGDSEAFTSVLYIEGVKRDSENVPALAAGDSLERQFDDWIYSPLIPLTKVVVDTNDDVDEVDEGNNEKQVTFVVETVFDFIDEAQLVNWVSGPLYIEVGFGIHDPDGFARYVTDTKLEDGSGPMKVLETHPKWVDDGWIEGAYEQMWDDDYVVEPGDYFVATVGFLEGAAAGEVRFRVMIRPEDDPDTWVASVIKDYGTPLERMEIPLSDFVGQKADFVLRVEAHGTSAQDWATWVEAKIIR